MIKLEHPNPPPHPLSLLGSRKIETHPQRDRTNGFFGNTRYDKFITEMIAGFMKEEKIGLTWRLNLGGRQPVVFSSQRPLQCREGCDKLRSQSSDVGFFRRRLRLIKEWSGFCDRGTWWRDGLTYSLSINVRRTLRRFGGRWVRRSEKRATSTLPERRSGDFVRPPRPTLLTKGRWDPGPHSV